MMNVYVVNWSDGYNPIELDGVYETLEAAKKRCSELAAYPEDEPATLNWEPVTFSWLHGSNAIVVAESDVTYTITQLELRS